MVNKCVVGSCNTIKAGDGITMHEIPTEQVLRSSWLRALYDETGQAVFHENDQICSKHFSPDSFDVINGVPGLKLHAIPFKHCNSNNEAPTNPKRSRIEEDNMKSTTTRSFVWEYCKKVTEISAICNLCNKELKYFGGTSNLREHLRRMHPAQFDPDSVIRRDNVELCSLYTNNSGSPTSESDRHDARDQQSKWTMKKLISTKASVKYEKAELSGKEKDKLDMVLLRMIVVDYKPLTIVEEPGFVEFIRKLQPVYSLPSKRSFSSEFLPATYDKIYAQLRLLIADMQNISLSIDIWTHDSKKAFLTLTGHFIYEGQLFSAVFATKELGRPSTPRITSLLSSLLNEWELNGKIMCVVSDNDSIIKGVVTDYFHLRLLPCIGHTLNFCVNHMLTSCDELVKLLRKCREIVSFFKQDASAMQRLLNVEQQMGIPEMKLKLDEVSMWPTTLTMLERLLRLKEPLSAELASPPRVPEDFSQTEWNVIGDLILILKPLDSLATELSSVNYPSVSLIIPIVRGLQHTIKARRLITQLGMSAQQILLTVVSKRFGVFELDPMCSKATFLDPRFKRAGFGTIERAESAQKIIVNELSTLLMNVEEAALEQINSQDQSFDDNDIWAHFDQKVARIKSSITPVMNAELIVKHYLQVPLIGRSQDPFGYWEQNKDVFPELYKLHGKYCCTPSTSVPVKSLITKEGKRVVGCRSRLSEKWLDKIIFLNSNISLFD